jgi:hypothetical protein
MTSAQDRLEILDLLARANRAADEKNVSNHAACYADGAVIEGDMQASGDADAFRADLKTIFENEPGLKRHVGSGHIFEQTGETVSIKSLLQVFDGEERPAVVATADIHDEVVRSGSEWKIHRHKVTMDPGTKKAMGGG